MGLEFQKFYRFILPGAIFLASDYIIFLDLLGLPNNIDSVNKYILLLSILVIILGVPLYWAYIVFWHFLFERNRMQSK